MLEIRQFYSSTMPASHNLIARCERSVLIALIILVQALQSHSSLAQGTFSIEYYGQFYCVEDDFVIFTLRVHNPTYPIIVNSYDNYPGTFYTGPQDLFYHEYEYPTNHAPEAFNSISVTNGDGQVLTQYSEVFGEHTPGEMGLYMDIYPYIPGQPIRGYIEVMDAEDVYDAEVTWLSTDVDEFEFVGHWEHLPAPAGSVMTFRAINTCDQATFDYLVPPPCILPHFQVLDVVASCNNIPSGRITLTIAPIGTGSGCGSIGAQIRNVNNTTWTSLNDLGPTANLNGLNAGSYWVRLRSGQYVFGDSILVEVPSTGAPCGRAWASVWLEQNQNCVLDQIESGLPNAVIKVLPGPTYANTASNGTTPGHL